MTGIRRYEPPSSGQLLQYILERPALVAAVRELPGELLGRLIERVGLEDAGELVALASTEQLAQVFDHDLWRAANVGADEDFDAQRFGIWLAVLSEAGDAFLAERLAALPRELLLLAVHRLVLVVDIDALALQLSDAGEEVDSLEKALESGLYEEWEEFRLFARQPECWDVLWSGLLALDRDHHDLVRDLIERCAALDSEYIEDNGGLYEVLSSDEMLEGDLAAERSDRRAAAGYVAPADARAFLALACEEPTNTERDPITRAHFRELAPVRAARTQVTREGHAPRTAALELGQLIEQATGSTPLRALPAPSRRRKPPETPPRTTLLDQALSELRETLPELASTRLEELAYLANVWMAGGAHEGRQPRPIEALELAVSVCTAGLVRALAGALPGPTPAVGDGELSPAASCLASTPADVLFRLGYAARSHE